MKDLLKAQEEMANSLLQMQMAFMLYPAKMWRDALQASMKPVRLQSPCG